MAATESFNNLVRADLRTQEGISLPVTLILLLFVFGSVVAAGLPLAVGLLTIPATLDGIALVALITNTSIYALNIARSSGWRWRSIICCLSSPATERNWCGVRCLTRSAWPSLHLARPSSSPACRWQSGSWG